MRSGRPRAARTLETVVTWSAVIVLLAMLVHVTANALMRSLLDRPIAHTLEMVEYWYMPLLTLLGFVVAQQRGQHIAADLLFERLSGGARTIVAVGGNLLGVVVCGAVTWYSFGEAQHARDIGAAAGLSDIPAWPVTYAVPLVFGALAVQFLRGALRGSLAGVDGIDPMTAEGEQKVSIQ